MTSYWLASGDLLQFCDNTVVHWFIRENGNELLKSLSLLIRGSYYVEDAFEEITRFRSRRGADLEYSLCRFVTNEGVLHKTV